MPVLSVRDRYNVPHDNKGGEDALRALYALYCGVRGRVTIPNE